METSVFIARLLAVIYLTVGLGLIVNSAYYKKAFEEMYKSPFIAFFGGISALVFGFLVLTVHNVWVMDWTVLITIIACFSLLKGVLLLLRPKCLLKHAKSFLNSLSLVGFFAVVFGLVFAYFGFFA